MVNFKSISFKVRLALGLMFLLSAPVCESAFCQVQKSKAKQLAFKYKDVQGRWTKWSDWLDCDVLVVTNFDKKTFTIYSKDLQEYDIIKTHGDEYNNEGNRVFRMTCIDINGKRCEIRRVFHEEYSQLYVDYADIIYVYNIMER